MTQSQLDIQLIGAVTAMACAIPGVFLILRRMAMLTDAIGHAILFGIVVAFFAVGNLNSPLLIIGAALAGLLTVSLVELLERTGRVKSDAATGIVFPLLFGVGVILVSKYADSVHLDTDSVLLGEIAFAPFTRFEVAGVDIGPQALWTMVAILVINALFVTLFYKELKIATFDSALASTLGLMPSVVHYLLMTSVSITTVGAFQTAGAVLIVAFIVGPPSTAFLLTRNLTTMIFLATGIGAGSAVLGYWVAYLIDTSIAGAMAMTIGGVFTVALLFSPDQGVLAGARRRVRQKWEFAQTMLVIHLFNHEGLPEAEVESRAAHLDEHLHWSKERVTAVIERAQANGLVVEQNGLLDLTDAGRARAAERIALA
jgi:manganese/zinc/iron transport system permease protein